MDIQGAEARAIQGMPLLLQKNKNLEIVTEFWPFGLKGSGFEPEEYLNLLTNHHFKLYHINSQEKKIEPINVSKILQTYTPEKKNYTNLLCVKDPSENHLGRVPLYVSED
jgi:hypothetical protein